MVRKFIPVLDYPTICSWWIVHEFPVVPFSYLPKNGFIVPNKAACFVYNADSKIAMMEWLVSNPDLDFDERNQVVNELLGAMLKWCQEHGYSHVFTTTNKDRLRERLEAIGFKKTDENVTHYLIGLGN